ncbi:sorbitol-6-phosphate 2-dehydrogenase [Dolosicoccus paucivorans]|uniref:SDR family oxidoreductase n=1 Tax=Dolosicoccus paucivorans TaxID=84521 RepID=UPI000C8050B6|nr:SDR family oxidoreductase [Dolosicoccus paucivorans]PMB85087.1 sorbitol-6-phosphate 2-dehydrogenase [Dolosicoccus paucivorans]
MSQWLDIAGKSVIVTGGSSGIGLSIVKELLDLGVKVANFDLQEVDLEHDNYLFHTVDVTDQEQVEKAVNDTVEAFGGLDGLVNNAGINIPALLVDKKEPHSQYELNDRVFDLMVNVNLKGFYYVAQAATRIFVEQESGVLINMASEAGLEGSEGQSVYAATKAAVYSFTRSWAKELGHYNVRAVGLAPGIMEETGLRTLEYEERLSYTRGITVDELRAGYSKTSTTPLGRSGKLDEVASTVAFMLSDKAGYITGVTLNIAGGKTRG